ncbi:MAG: aminoacyl-tRNA hydrolase [Chloroflexi bacterium]|nr:aminoacyl-tRNA hydrolase [Chloroflexota bacterium]
MPFAAPGSWTIVGLGNPGPAYSHTRHNVGYWCVNQLARKYGIELRARRLYAVGEGQLNGEPVVLAKPRTYVNRSGHAVSALLKHSRLSSERLLVICDDLDLPLGRVRLRAEGGHGGHRGLQSLISNLGTREFPRLRLGIGRPMLDGESITDPDVVAVYVLSEPSEQEREVLQEAVGTAVAAVEVTIGEGVEAAMNRFNR